MTLHHGVDSYNRVDTVVNATTGEPHGGQRGSASSGFTLWDFYVQRYGEAPSFWGRYINRRTSAALDPTEVAYIHQRSGGACGIGLVYNELSSSDVLPLRGADARRRGRAAARDAIGLAIHAGARPQANSTRIFLDLERWNVAPDLLLGWFEEMAGSDFLGLGGLYGRVFPSFRPADAAVARRRTRRPDWQEGAVYPWSRALPWAIGRFAEERSVDEVIGDILSDGGLGTHRDYSCALWDPRYIVGAGRTHAQQPPPWPARFDAGANIGGTTTVWQWANDVSVAARTGSDGTVRHFHLYDLNVATPRGLSEMWRPG